MNNWLLPVRTALDAAPEPITFFFRDDDGGWLDERLWNLMALCVDKEITLDIAVIPYEITPAFGKEMLHRLDSNPELFRVHQHGYAHLNHESEGRKCEFGPSRNAQEQLNDIKLGQDRMRDAFGSSDPIFTPPWNRCTTVTAGCLKELGFSALSRDETAERFGISGLSEIPINIDWFAKKKGIPLSKEEIGEKIAKKISENQPVGIMFHHVLMDQQELQYAAELFGLLARHDSAKCVKMSSLYPAAQTVCRGVTI